MPDQCRRCGVIETENDIEFTFLHDRSKVCDNCLPFYNECEGCHEYYPLDECPVFQLCPNCKGSHTMNREQLLQALTDAALQAAKDRLQLLAPTWNGTSLPQDAVAAAQVEQLIPPTNVKVTPKICQTCTHWRLQDDRRKLGECAAIDVTDDTPIPNMGGAIIAGADGPVGQLVTSATFRCGLWEKPHTDPTRYPGGNARVNYCGNVPTTIPMPPMAVTVLHQWLDEMQVNGYTVTLDPPLPGGQ